MATKASKSKSKTGDTLRLTLMGSKLEVDVRIKSLASSKAGTTGFSFRGLCATHKAPVKAPKVCSVGGAECGEMVKENTLKGYEVGDRMLTLTHEQVAALKPRGDDTVRILQLLRRDQAGALAPKDDVARLMGNVKALTPADDAAARRFAAVHALIGRDRIAIAQVTHKGAFGYAAIHAAEGGALLAHELFLPRDTYEIPEVDLPDLTAAERAAMMVKGEALAAEATLDMAALDNDPYREAREAAIIAALKSADGKVTVETEPVPVAPEADEDIVALLG